MLKHDFDIYRTETQASSSCPSRFKFNAAIDDYSFRVLSVRASQCCYSYTRLRILVYGPTPLNGFSYTVSAGFPNLAWDPREGFLFVFFFFLYTASWIVAASTVRKWHRLLPRLVGSADVGPIVTIRVPSTFAYLYSILEYLCNSGQLNLQFYPRVATTLHRSLPTYTLTCAR